MEYLIFALLGVQITFFSVASYMKLAAHPHMLEEFASFGYPYWLARLSAVLEIVGVSCLLIGFWQPLFTVLGGVWLAGIMAGASYINFTKRPPSFGWGTLVLVLLCLVPPVYYRAELISLIGG